MSLPPRRHRRPAALLAAAAVGASALLATVDPAPLAAQEASAGLPGDTLSVAAPEAGPAAASDPRVDSLTARVASQLRCPVCRSQSVLESSSDLANRMQSVIRERLASGDSPAEVRRYFVDKYGEWILLKPEPEGINLLVYVLPALALLGGGWAVAHRLREWSSAGVTDEGARASAGPAPGDGEAGETGGEEPDSLTSDLDLSEEDREWLERELEDRR